MAKVVKIQKTPAQLVDEIGALRAQLAGPQKTLKALEAQLKAFGTGTYQGVLWDANVSSHTRETLDMDAVRAKLSPQFLTAHTNETEVTTLRVTAKLPATAAVAA